MDPSDAMKFPISLRDYFAGQLVIGLGVSIAQADAERYRWLKANHVGIIGIPAGDGATYVSGDSLDIMIDRTMLKTTAPHRER